MKLIYRGCKSSGTVDQLNHMKPDREVSITLNDCEKVTGSVRLEFTSYRYEEVWSGVRNGREIALVKESERGPKPISANEIKMVYLPVNKNASAIMVLDGISLESGGTGRLHGTYTDGGLSGSWVINLVMSKQTIVGEG